MTNQEKAQQEIDDLDDVYEGETKPRRQSVATILTFLCPGLGYMYTGQLLKGITVNLLFLLILECFVVVFAILKFFPLLPVAVLILAWFIFTTFVMASVARSIEPETSERFVLKGYNHWTIYGLMFLFTYALPIFITGHFVNRYLLGSATLEAESMLPTLKGGDTVFIDRSAYRNKLPHQGDLVAVRSNDETVVLRVVAVPNDIVQIEGERVIVNGAPLPTAEFDENPLSDENMLAMVELNRDRKYPITLARRSFNAIKIDPIKIKSNQIYALADNRSLVDPKTRRLRDSRHFGAIDDNDIVGEPLFIGWSDSDDGVRWDRIGLRIR